MAHKPVRTVSSFLEDRKINERKRTQGTLFTISIGTIALQCALARHQAPEPKNILKPPRVLTKTLNWPNIPKKLGKALILKTCQFFISVPNGTSVCFWKRGTPKRRTQSTSTSSFNVCTSTSRIFRTFLAHALCVFVTYLSILPPLVLFAYVTNEGHRRNRFCSGVPLHKGITVVPSLFRSHWLAVVYCLVF